MSISPATLSIECQPLTAPRPTAILVRIDGQMVGYIELDHFKRLAARLFDLENPWDRGSSSGKFPWSAE